MAEGESRLEFNSKPKGNLADMSKHDPNNSLHQKLVNRYDNQDEEEEEAFQGLPELRNLKKGGSEAAPKRDSKVSLPAPPPPPPPIKDFSTVGHSEAHAKENDELRPKTKVSSEPPLDLDPKKMKFNQVTPIAAAPSSRSCKWAWSGEPMPSFAKTGKIRIMFLTWNMAGKGPRSSVEDIFNTMMVKHHIYVIATQECCHSILTSFIFNSKSKWKTKINQLLGKDYSEVACVSMNAMNLSIYCHSSVAKLVHGIESETVKTGLFGIFGNKGAINISIKIAEFSLLVYAMHLQHGDSSYFKRNQNLEKIRRESKIPTKKKDPLSNSVFVEPIDKRADLVVVMGDLNYRVEGLKPEELTLAISEKREKDQLAKAMKQEPCMNGLMEYPFAFGPSYKFVKDTSDLDYKRTPSFTDRILFGGLKRDNFTCDNYENNVDVKWGDHSPVFIQGEFKGIQVEEDRVYETNETSHCCLI